MKSLVFIFLPVALIVFNTIGKAQTLQKNNALFEPSLLKYSATTKAAQPHFNIASNYAEKHYGFICKKELQIEKQTKIPLRIRVGSLENCNYMEGKLHFAPTSN